MARPADPRRAKYRKKFNLPIYRTTHRFPRKLLDQLDACKSDMARRLILGKSK